MTEFIDLLKNSEDWLIIRVLFYSEKYEFTKYTSTLAEAWRMSISGLSGSLISAVKYYNNVIPEFHPDDKYVDDPISEFGVIEAQKHRQRGTTLGMFLGLMKYFKQSYLDLIEISSLEEAKKTYYKNFTQRSFDRIEIAYCIEWTSRGSDELMIELQDSNRKITNEKNKYLTIFESIDEPIVLLDEAQKILNMNQAAMELFTNLKVSGSIYYGSGSSDAFFEHLNQQILEFINSKPSETNFETQLSTLKGDLSFEVRLKKMMDFSKKFSGTVVMLEDISDRKRVEVELNRQHSLMDTLLRNLHIGVYMLEVPSGIPLMANEASFNLLGRGILPDANSSTITKVYDLYKTGTDIPYPNEELPLIEAMSGISKHVDDMDVQKPDGTRLALEVFGSPIRNERGDIWASLVSFQDITERKKAELSLNESRQRLSMLNSDKDRFISILGHDLKNPISNLLGLSDVLKEEFQELNTIENESIINDINKSAALTNKLLDDILMWARTQQGNIVFSPQNLRLVDVCNQIIDILKPNAYAKGIAISCKITGQLFVHADVDMLSTIVLNLVTNSLKFTNNNGLIIIDAEQKDTDIIISVSDNGIGISNENIGKLFNISEVLSTKGTENETGTGLGLLICKEFVEKHNGKIWVESEEGVGSSFYFSIPHKG